jgi:hypothetical protein
VEGAGDDALDQDLPLPYEHPVRLLARLVELLQRYYAGVGRHLEDGVGGGVDDPGPRRLLLRSELLDYLRPRGWPVADDAPPGLFLEPAQDPVGEAVGVGR